jgi:hypothetical protein
MTSRSRIVKALDRLEQQANGRQQSVRQQEEDRVAEERR